MSLQDLLNDWSRADQPPLPPETLALPGTPLKHCVIHLVTPSGDNSRFAQYFDKATREDGWKHFVWEAPNEPQSPG